MAAFQWESNRIELTAFAGDPEAVGLFHFKNISAVPVTITHVQTSCDCTTATPSATTFSPGQSGFIRASLKIGNRLGRQEKTIDVTTTADESDQPTRLILHVAIAEIITCEPRMVQWQQDHLEDEKWVVISAIDHFKIRALTLPAETAGFSCALEKSGDDRTYRLKIKPAANAVATRRVLQLSADVEGRPPLVVAVYAVIHPGAARP